MTIAEVLAGDNQRGQRGRDELYMICLFSNNDTNRLGVIRVGEKRRESGIVLGVNKDKNVTESGLG